ncbi:MAG: MurR/RpiR family transcriptional regulator [Thermoleophilia bacterium]
MSEMLQERFDTFSRSQKAVARYIVDHLEETGYMSAEELARMGDTSSSTVVRFAQSLGFSGYPDLQKAAREEHRLGAASRPVVHEDQLLFVVEEDFLTRAVRTDILSLEETLAKNSVAAFNQAVELLAEAEQVAVIGPHEAAPVGEQAAYLFELLGLTTLAIREGSEAEIARIARLAAGDVVLAIGFRKAHPLTIAMLRRAREAGTQTISITDNTLSELAGKAQVTLFADIDSTFFAHSLVGPLSLVNALAAAVYARDRERHDAFLEGVRRRPGSSRRPR